MFKLNNILSIIILISMIYSGELLAAPGCVLSNDRFTITNQRTVIKGSEEIGQSYGNLSLTFDYTCEKYRASDSIRIAADNRSSSSGQAPTNIDGLVIQSNPSHIVSGSYEWQIPSNGNLIQSGTLIQEAEIVKNAFINDPKTSTLLTYKSPGQRSVSAKFESYPFWITSTDNRADLSIAITLVDGCHLTFSSGTPKVDFGEMSLGEIKTVSLTAQLEGCFGNYSGASWKLIPQAMTGNSWTSDVLTSSGASIPTISYYFRQSGSGTNLNFSTAYPVNKVGGGSITSLLSLDITAQVSPTSITGPFTNMIVLESEFY